MGTEITPGLKVFGCEVEDLEMKVDLYGGPNNAFGCVRFSHSDRGDLERHENLVKAWMDANVEVDMVVTDSKIKLVRSGARGEV